MCAQRLFSCSKHERRYFIWFLFLDVVERDSLHPAARCTGAKGDVHVEIVRVVMDAIGVADGVSGMESLREFSHHFPHGGLQNPVGVDSGLHEFVV